jgi:hypothetical protein
MHLQVRDRFISYSKYSRRGTLFIQKKVGSALTETENWDLLVDCTSRDGRQMLDAGVHLFLSFKSIFDFFSLHSSGRRQGKINLKVS